MLRATLDALHPYGWTSRRTYCFALIGLVLWVVLITLLQILDTVPEWTLVLLAFPAFIILVLLTVRRLRDAGLSVYWALLMFVPVRLVVDLATIELGGAELRFIDFTQILNFIPLLLGLLVPGRPPAERNL